MPAADDKERQEGRGRLSSIDLLPEDAEPDLIWAHEQLRDRAMHSNVIHSEFNARLADRGIGPISKSAWGRYAVRKAMQFRKIDATRAIASELAPTLGTDGSDHVTMLIAEMVKVAAFQMLEEGPMGTKGLMELARAVATATGAQKTSAENRRQLEAEVAQRLKDTADAVAKVGAQAGVGAETLRKITNLLTTGQA
jgi:hypothetical protein